MSSNQTLGASVPAARMWRVVIPVKHRATAKSRLRTPVGVSRSQLAQAMARDTVQAAAAAVGPESLTVVTSDEQMAAWALAHDITVLPDPGRGLNAALTVGLSSLSGSHVAVLLGDLPALRPGQLRVALAACAGQRLALVPDRAGTGTSLLTSAGPTLVPAFGPNSAQRHQQVLGAVALDLPVPGLRQDVDTEADLAAAVALGVGRHTQHVLARQ